MTTVVISQPMLFPWPGFFEMLFLADIYIHRDEVLFSKSSFTRRIQIRTGQECEWLTLPLKGHTSSQTIAELEATSDDWKKQHLRFLEKAYHLAPYKDKALSYVHNAYQKEKVIDILIDSFEAPAQYLDVLPKKRIFASTLPVEGRGSEKVLKLVQAVGGTRYVTAHGAINYLDHEAFEQAGIAIDYMDYSYTPWPQRAEPFTPFVSILDALAWNGDKTKDIIKPATMPWQDFIKKAKSHDIKQ